MIEPSEQRVTFAAMVAELIRQNPSEAPGSPHALTAIDIDPQRFVAVFRVESSRLTEPLLWRFHPELDQPPDVADEYVGFELAELYVALESGAFEVEERDGRRWITF